MTYLDLVNAVLVRLREKKVSALDINPFVSLIQATVNDAKVAVEDAWDWSQQRAYEELQIALGGQTLILPDSADNNYQIHNILNKQGGYYLQYQYQPYLFGQYRDAANTPVPQGPPRYWTWGVDDPNTGNKTLELFQPSDNIYNLIIYRSKRQSLLSLKDDRLKVPAMPVVQLAVAMASRERGEIGGTPTGELFNVAERYLSDAIAYDSAKFANEMDWFVGQRLNETNVRGF